VPKHYVLPDVQGVNTVSIAVEPKNVWRMGDIVREGVVKRGEVLSKKYQNPMPTLAHLLHIEDPGHANPNVQIVQMFLAGPFTVSTP
jgi:hypothetical protein